MGKLYELSHRVGPLGLNHVYSRDSVSRSRDKNIIGETQSYLSFDAESGLVAVTGRNVDGESLNTVIPSGNCRCE